MPKVKLGRLVSVENKDRKFGSATEYKLLWIEDSDGCNERPILLTDHEIEAARNRAIANTEDIVAQSKLWNLLT
jgi:hypothetical protein